MLGKKGIKRIFKDEKTTLLYLMDLILKQIKETVSTTLHSYPSNPPTSLELRTHKQLGMHDIILNALRKKERIVEREKEFWHPPPNGYLKCNIDGASKSNPATAGYGGVLRDEDGKIIFALHCHLGHASNNMVELMVLKQCLELLKLNNSSNVLIEADSEISINAVKKISYGTARERVSKRWRLIQVHQRIQKHLQSLRMVSFNHVWQKANKLADLPANLGVTNPNCRVEMKWQEMPTSRLKALCETQAAEDKEIFDCWARGENQD